MNASPVLPSHRDTIVIGAGQSGLAAAYWLSRAGADFAIIEAGGTTTGSWPAFYDSLKLFSPARYSALPGLPFPGDPDRYPVRDEVTRYLADYAAMVAPPVHFNQSVTRVTRGQQGFVVETASGRRWTANRIISAAGIFGQPRVPVFPGHERFEGQLIHSAQYRNPGQLADGPVGIVGGGNSALQIALELAQGRAVTLFLRHPLRFLPQRLLGQDIHRWLIGSGFDWLPFGAWFGVAPGERILDPGIYRAAVAAGRIGVRPMFSHLTATGAAMPDGDSVPLATLLMATGFETVPRYLADLLPAAGEGRPVQRGGYAVGVPGLAFLGMPWQVSHRSATLRGVGGDARRIVTRLLATRGAGMDALQAPA